MQTIYIVVQSFSNPHGVRTTPIWPTFFFLRHLRHSYLTKYDRMIECAHEKQEKQEHITTRPFVELRIVHFNCCHLWVNLPLELEQIRLLGSCQAWEMKFAAEWHWKRASCWATHVRTVLREWDSTWHNEQFNITQRIVAWLQWLLTQLLTLPISRVALIFLYASGMSPLNIGEWPLCIASLHRDEFEAFQCILHENHETLWDIFIWDILRSGYCCIWCYIV